MSKNTAPWDEQRNTIHSTKGGWVVGKGVFNHGYSMMDDLVGKTSYIQVMVLNATGRLPQRKLADWLEAIHICLSWPDPRIWCNTIGALGGTARTSPVAATAAGILANDSKMYGAGTGIDSLNFIQWALSEKQRGLSTGEIIKNECAKHRGKPNIMGFARPIAKGDERVVAMQRVQKELGFPIGQHQALANEIDAILQRNFSESINIGGYISAFLADQHYTANEVCRIFSILVSSGVTACYTDTIKKPAGTFLPIKCSDIDYQGKPPRELP